MRTKNVTIREPSTTPVLHEGAPANTEEQLDWVEQLQPTYLVWPGVGPTRSGKTRLAAEFNARVINQGGDDDDQI